MIGAAILAIAAGAADGIGASKDLDAARSWDTPGMTPGGVPLVAWGWAPAAQVGGIAVGAAGVMQGKEWGRGPLYVGAGLFARAAAVKLAQHRQPDPAPVQG